MRYECNILLGRGIMHYVSSFCSNWDMQWICGEFAKIQWYKHAIKNKWSYSNVYKLLLLRIPLKTKIVEKTKEDKKKSQNSHYVHCTETKSESESVVTKLDFVCSLIKTQFVKAAFTLVSQHDTSRHTKADNLVSMYAQGSFLRFPNTKISHYLRHCII